MVYAVTALCLENGLLPVLAATGSRGSRLVPLLEKKLAEFRETPQLLAGADFVSIRQAVEERQVNLVIGSSEGRYLEERCGIPLVRLGFPILDRVGGARQLSVGYEGTVLLLDRLTNALLDHKHKHYRKAMEDAFWRPEEANNTSADDRRI
jgi:nitrogenase molybdenum-iron protein NifN